MADAGRGGFGRGFGEGGGDKGKGKGKDGKGKGKGKGKGEEKVGAATPCQQTQAQTESCRRPRADAGVAARGCQPERHRVLRFPRGVP